MKLREILDEEGRMVFSLESSKTAEDAIAVMTERHASAVIIFENDHPAGIFTERDVMNCYIRYKGRPFREIPLREGMTNKLIVGKLEDDVEDTVSMMVQADIRHLPVVEGRKIIGIVHICDLLHHQLGTLNMELQYLEDYLADLHNAVTD